MVGDGTCRSQPVVPIRRWRNAMTARDVTAEIHGFSEPDATPTSSLPPLRDFPSLPGYMRVGVLLQGPLMC